MVVSPTPGTTGGPAKVIAGANGCMDLSRTQVLQQPVKHGSPVRYLAGGLFHRSLPMKHGQLLLRAFPCTRPAARLEQTVIQRVREHLIAAGPGLQRRLRPASGRHRGRPARPRGLPGRFRPGPQSAPGKFLLAAHGDPRCCSSRGTAPGDCIRTVSGGNPAVFSPLPPLAVPPVPASGPLPGRDPNRCFCAGWCREPITLRCQQASGPAGPKTRSGMQHATRRQPPDRPNPLNDLAHLQN
jgi:hypothetical protein